MYDRARRRLEWQTGSTPQDVGPGTYYVEKFGQARESAAAPFLTMSRRSACSRVLDDLPEVSPGPSFYDPVPVHPRVLGGNTVATTEKRFKQQITPSPGPGAYNLKCFTEKSEQIHSSSCLTPYVVESETSPSVGRLMRSRIRYRGRRNLIVPSIPSRGMALGFMEQKDGTLIKVNPSRNTVLIGPTTYDQTMVETRATRQYRGVHFGKMGPRKTSVFLFRKSSVPGPGTYDVERGPKQAEKGSAGEVAVVRNTSGGTFTTSRPPQSEVLRFSEAIMRETEKMNIPGPGKYHIRSQFDPVPPRITPLEGLVTEKPPFLSQAKRFSYVKNTVPAPGTYDDPRSAMSVLKKRTGLTRSPFGQTSARFQKVTKAKDTPGPGAYNFRGMAVESQRKAFHESTRKGVFGTTAPRDLPGPGPDASEQPGPADYQVKNKPFQPRFLLPSANFLSATDRPLSEPNAPIKELPAPGFYNVAESYQKSQVVVHRAKPRTAAAALKHGSFVSAAPRFERNRGIGMPGPGSYNLIGDTVPSKGGLMVCRDKRFKLSKSSVPGPSTYVLSPAVQDSVLKGTFNITLANPFCSLSPPP